MSNITRAATCEKLVETVSGDGFVRTKKPRN